MAVVGVGVAPVGVGCGGATPPKKRDSGMPFGIQTARRRTGIGAECWRGVRDSAPSRECRPGGWYPLRPQRYRRAIGPGRIGPQAVLPPIFLDAPELVGGGFRGGGRAYRRQKSAPGRVPRWRQTSEPGYHPHRLRHGTENPSKRRPCLSFHAMRSLHPTFTPQPTSEVYTPRRGVPLRIHRSRKTSDLPPGIEPPSFHPY